jgi:hypothetical protein
MSSWHSSYCSYTSVYCSAVLHKLRVQGASGDGADDSNSSGATVSDAFVQLADDLYASRYNQVRTCAHVTSSPNTIT